MLAPKGGKKSMAHTPFRSSYYSRQGLSSQTIPSRIATHTFAHEDKDTRVPTGRGGVETRFSETPRIYKASARGFHRSPSPKRIICSTEICRPTEEKSRVMDEKGRASTRSMARYLGYEERMEYVHVTSTSPPEVVRPVEDKGVSVDERVRVSTWSSAKHGCYEEKPKHPSYSSSSPEHSGLSARSRLPSKSSRNTEESTSGLRSDHNRESDSPRHEDYGTRNRKRRRYSSSSSSTSLTNREDELLSPKETKRHRSEESRQEGWSRQPCKKDIHSLGQLGTSRHRLTSRDQPGTESNDEAESSLNHGMENELIEATTIGKMEEVERPPSQPSVTSQQSSLSQRIVDKVRKEDRGKYTKEEEEVIQPAKKESDGENNKKEKEKEANREEDEKQPLSTRSEVGNQIPSDAESMSVTATSDIRDSSKEDSTEGDQRLGMRQHPEDGLQTCSDSSAVQAKGNPLQKVVDIIENSTLPPRATSGSPTPPPPHMPILPPHMLPPLPPYSLLPPLPPPVSSSMAATIHGALPCVMSSLHSAAHAAPSPLIADDRERGNQCSSASSTAPSPTLTPTSSNIPFPNPLVMPIYLPYPPPHVMTSDYHQYLMQYQQLTYGRQMSAPWGYAPPTDRGLAAVASADEGRMSRSRSGTPVMDESDSSTPVELLATTETEVNDTKLAQDSACSTINTVDAQLTQPASQIDPVPVPETSSEPMAVTEIDHNEGTNTDNEEEEAPPSPLCFKVLHYSLCVCMVVHVFASRYWFHLFWCASFIACRR